jgi:protoporphyrinogen/coproporphyrinogen III oxidase
MSAAPSIAIVGGGIAGLTAAHALLRSDSCEHARLRSSAMMGSQAARRSQAPSQPRLTLIEADARLGGKLRSEPIAGLAVDVGAESLLARVPAGIGLCHELGLQDELVGPIVTGTGVWARGRLRELPAGLLGGLPQGLGPVLRSGILSPLGVARASLDLLLPAAPANGDRAVGELVGSRLGLQALDRLVDPLLGTIYGAGCETLSLRATAPQLEALSRERRSLILGLRAARPAPASSGPPFVTLPGGLERIVARLREGLAEADVRTGTSARLLSRAPDGGYRLLLSDGEWLMADGVVIATPARDAARLLAGLAPLAASELQRIGYLSTVVVTLRYPCSAKHTAPLHAGFLVPHGERRLLGACTWLSSKWQHFAASGELWLRCSVARARVDDALRWDDAELVRALSLELRRIVGLSQAPLSAHVTRWEHALPHYRIGHLERVARIERHLQKLPGIALAGAAYRGMGVPQCIAQGRAAAEQVLAAVGSTVQE